MKYMNKLLEKIIPDYAKYNPVLSRNAECLQALENYTRYAIRQIDIPKFCIVKYQRLKEAIEDLPPGLPVSRKELLEEYPELLPYITLLERCLQFYPETLLGKVSYGQVLFPHGNFNFVESIYRNNPISDYHNSYVAKVVSNYLKIHKDNLVKIIEIGAGTGSTTKFVLPEVKSFQVDYYYTDISLAFLQKAKHEFSSYPRLFYQLYNIELPVKKEFENQFDILIATNVLHATANMKNTLTNVRTLLKNNGIAIINEATARSDFATITFGLTDGWWLFQDNRIPNSPLIDQKTWLELLKLQGFSTTFNQGNSFQTVLVVG